MKCEIIRDLLPSYADGLTSEVSNEAVKEHLEHCESCRVYYEEMQQEEPKILEKAGREIDYFLRVREETIGKVLIAIVATTVVFSFLFGAYRSYYGYKSALSHEITAEVQVIDNFTTVVFGAAKDGWHISYGYTENEKVDGKQPLCTISLSKARINPLRPTPPENRWSLGFREGKNIVMNFPVLPEELTYEESDFIAVRFADCVKTITLADLRDGDISSLQ